MPESGARNAAPTDKPSAPAYRLWAVFDQERLRG
jgi:hypothetical protein